MTYGLWKGSLLVVIISLYWKKDFLESTPNIQTLMFGSPRRHIWAVGYHSHPPLSQLAFHIYYVKYEDTLMCKRISWDSGGMMFKNIFSISYMYV